MSRSDDCRCYCGRSVRDPIPVIGHVDNPIDGEIPAQCIMHESARLLPERLWLFTKPMGAKPCLLGPHASRHWGLFFAFLACLNKSVLGESPT
jgi:hypothetical protein